MIVPDPSGAQELSDLLLPANREMSAWRDYVHCEQLIQATERTFDLSKFGVDVRRRALRFPLAGDARNTFRKREAGKLLDLLAFAPTLVLNLSTSFARREVGYESHAVAVTASDLRA